MNLVADIIRVSLRRLGLELRRKDPEAWARGFYEFLRPWASYAPWRKDKEFLRIYGLIANHTLVDVYRCWELWDLAGQCMKLEGDIIEVGVYKGGTGGILCARARRYGAVRTVYLADTFAGVVKTSKNDPNYSGGEHSDTSEETVAALLRDRLELDNYKILKGVFPEETGHLAGPGPFSFCHIDVDSYLSAKDVLEWCWPKLCLGGMVVFDDYGFESTPGIAEYVDKVKNAKDRLSFYNLNGHAILVKLE